MINKAIYMALMYTDWFKKIWKKYSDQNIYSTLESFKEIFIYFYHIIDAGSQ